MRVRHPFVVSDTGIHRGESADPCVVVIFGASGDLARRQLIPSLFELALKKLLPDPIAIIGVSSSDWTSDTFRQEMSAVAREQCPSDEPQWKVFAERLSYIRGDAASQETCAALVSEIDRVRSASKIGDNVLFHLAVPPSAFAPIAARLGESGLAHTEHGWRRLVIEKPFGRDRATAQALDRELRDVFGEEQIYRIDHFLGKETVQNMLVFRFANPSFEPIWNRNFIDHVQITVAESIGIGTRAGFYEQTGIVRDMVQNHLLSLLCMTAMEPPVRYDATSLRDETAKVLDAILMAPFDVDKDAVRGQYGSGTVDHASAPEYRGEKNVAPDSHTPTYAAIKLNVDNWRWNGVPFYLRTGKRMTRGITEVAIQFKPTPHSMFPDAGRHPYHSVLVFEVQPDEGIVHTLAAKQPGPGLALTHVTMNFDYAEAFGIEEPPRAYAWLLLDAMQGDQTLFARADWIDKAWQIIDPLVQRWETMPAKDFPNYAAGSDGPAAAARLVERDGRHWRSLDAGNHEDTKKPKNTKVS